MPTRDELMKMVPSCNQFEQEVAEARTQLTSLEQKTSSVEFLFRSMVSDIVECERIVKDVGPFVLALVSGRTHRKPGWKAKVKARAVSGVEPHKYYSPADVAAILNVSYDTSIRRMLEMPGVVDFGTQESRFKRPKRKLRISGRDLMDYIRKHTVDESN